MGRTGHKNPPVEHRWKKGQSGNPSGRPKKASTPQQDIAALLFEPIHVNDRSGRKKPWHLYEVALTNFCKKLLGESPAAFCRGFLKIEQLLAEAQVQREQEETWPPIVLKHLKDLRLQVVDGAIVQIKETEASD
jgi:hypothetical protein